MMPHSRKIATNSADNLKQPISPLQKDASKLDCASIVALSPPSEQAGLYSLRNNVYLDELSYNDLVVKSGIFPHIAQLNFESIEGEAVYEHQFRDTDATKNTGGSLDAARNFARCTGGAGYMLGNKFYLPSDLAGDTKAARFGIIKSKGVFHPAGQVARGWICKKSGRFRQLAGTPLALKVKNKKNGKGFAKETLEPQRYFQRK